MLTGSQFVEKQCYEANTVRLTSLYSNDRASLISKWRRDQLDATISDVLVINCSSTCFGRLYAHHQEARLRFTAYDFLSCCSWCDVDSSSNLLHTVHTACHPTLQHHNSYNRTENRRQWNAVWPPDDGRKDARNVLRNHWLPINSLLFRLVGLAFIY